MIIINKPGGIKTATHKNFHMQTQPINMEAWQVNYIANNSEKKTFKQLADVVQLPILTVRDYCHANGIVTKWSSAPVNVANDITKRRLKRPPTIYTQSASPYGIADDLHNKKLIAGPRAGNLLGSYDSWNTI